MFSLNCVKWATGYRYVFSHLVGGLEVIPNQQWHVYHSFCLNKSFAMFCWGWTCPGKIRWWQGRKVVTAEQERVAGSETTVAGTGAKVWGHLVDGELRVWLKGMTEGWGQLCDKFSWKKLPETNKQTKLKLVSGPCFKFHLSNYFFQGQGLTLKCMLQTGFSCQIIVIYWSRSKTLNSNQCKHDKSREEF